MTPCGSTPMTSARWSGGSRVSASSSHDRISAARGLSLGSSVNSAAALGLISFAMRMPRKRTRMHLRGASGDLTHHATMLKRIESAAPAGLASPARPDGGPPSPRRLLKKDHAPTYYGRDLLYLRTPPAHDRGGFAAAKRVFGCKNVFSAALEAFFLSGAAPRRLAALPRPLRRPKMQF